MVESRAQVYPKINDAVVISMYDWLKKNRPAIDAQILIRALMRSGRINALEKIEFPLDWVRTSYAGNMRTLQSIVGTTRCYIFAMTSHGIVRQAGGFRDLGYE